MVSTGVVLSSAVNVCISGCFCPATRQLHLVRQSIHSLRVSRIDMAFAVGLVHLLSDRLLMS